MSTQHRDRGFFGYLTLDLTVACILPLYDGQHSAEALEQKVEIGKISFTLSEGGEGSSKDEDSSMEQGNTHYEQSKLEYIPASMDRLITDSQWKGQRRKFGVRTTFDIGVIPT